LTNQKSQLETTLASLSEEKTQLATKIEELLAQVAAVEAAKKVSKKSHSHSPWLILEAFVD